MLAFPYRICLYDELPHISYSFFAIRHNLLTILLRKTVNAKHTVLTSCEKNEYALFADYFWLVVFNVPSTARSFRDSTPIYCPLQRT